MKNSKELIELLNLSKIDNTNFSGESVTIGSTIVFGGQVLAQAVNAAYRTIPEDRFLHSLHSYFLLSKMKVVMKFKKSKPMQELV